MKQQSGLLAVGSGIATPNLNNCFNGATFDADGCLMSIAGGGGVVR